MSQSVISLAYRQTLRDLGALDLRFACIGTFGLHLLGVLPRDYSLHDADIVMDADATAISRCHAWLAAEGWQFLLWDEPVRQLPPVNVLLEKYYLRARRGELCLDIVFGGLPIDIAGIMSRSENIDGIPVACRADILDMKRQRNSAADKLLLDEIHAAARR